MMSKVTNRKQSYRSAVDQAVKWILSHQEENGGFGPIETMSHYMLVGAALLYTGCPQAAARLMPVLKKLFVRTDGSFDPPEVRAGRKSALIERGYAPSWMIYSSHLNLSFDISLPAMPHLLKFLDPNSGGMFGSQEDSERGKGIINAAVTCVAGEAALTTGYIAEAQRMGDHLVNNLIARNPDLNKAFYPVWDTEYGLRTDPEAPSAPNMPGVLLRYEPEQHHFLTGMMIGFLTDLYRTTAAGKYLDAAVTLYDFAAGGTPAIYESTISHKFAWGCAWLYRLTGKAEHLDSACRLCDYLVSIQEKDGSFVHWAFVKSADEWPYSPRLNTTAQFALWISRTLNLL
jgi:hypothetical protein